MISLDSYLDGITTVAISGHIRPDGDCVGSCLAVYNYICDNYPTIMADLYLEPIPEKFLFLKNADKISVTSHLLILITSFQMQVLPQNWYIS